MGNLLFSLVYKRSSNRTYFCAYHESFLVILAGDALGRVLSVTDKDKAVTKYAYDPLGVYEEQTDPNGKVTHTEYNKVGQVVSETDAEGGVTKFQYDAFGRLHAQTNARDFTAQNEDDYEGGIFS